MLLNPTARLPIRRPGTTTEIVNVLPVATLYLYTAFIPTYYGIGVVVATSAGARR